MDRNYLGVRILCQLQRHFPQTNVNAVHIVDIIAIVLCAVLTRFIVVVNTAVVVIIRITLQQQCTIEYFFYKKKEIN